MPSARQVRFLSGFTYYLGRYGLALPCQLMRRVSRARVAAAKRRERAFNSSRARRFGSVSRWRWTTEARGMTPSRAPTVASLGCSRPSDASPETASDERQECRRTAPSIGRRMPGPTPLPSRNHRSAPFSGERGAGSGLHPVAVWNQVEVQPGRGPSPTNPQVRHPCRPVQGSPRTPHDASSETDRTPATSAPGTRPPGSTPGRVPAPPGRTRRTRCGGRRGPSGA